MKTITKKLIAVAAVLGCVIGFQSANAQYSAVPGVTDAVLNATVNPNGTATSAWFEYGTDRNMNMYAVKETPHVYMGSARGEVPLSQKIMSLAPNTTYYYRGVASNGTVVKGAILSFTTTTTNVTQTNTVYTTTPASVQTTGSNYNYATNTMNDGVEITDITATGAILNAVLTNPNRNSAQGYFEWGTTPSLGASTPMTDLGTEYSSSFSGRLTNLTPNTTYYFRAVALLNGKRISGSIKNFQTFGSTVTNTIQTPTYQAPIISSYQPPVSQVTNTAVTKTLPATAVFGATFLPNNLFGWLILLIIILAVLWVIRKLSTPTTYVVHR